MDTKFSSALHMLILISESKETMSSEELALSVGTNPSYIRKISSRLVKSGIIKGHRGISGFTLKEKSNQITLLDIYKSVMKEKIHFFDIHQNPNDKCIVGQNIKPTLNNLFSGVEKEAEAKLKEITLADCIKKMKQIKEKNESSNIKKIQ